MKTLQIDPDAALPNLLAALSAALDGGPAITPLDTRATADDVALVLATSGSTGAPKLVELGATALRHSAAATHARLGGTGRWLLALPLTHIAGWQVLVRSLDAGLDPVHVAPAVAPAEFAEAAGHLGGPRRYTSLVPTQLVRLLRDAAATDALAGFDAVLLGGAAAPQRLLEQARASGVRIVTTYGMTETSGGCVYDRRPLDGVSARLDDEGRVMLAGPVLAQGKEGFVTHAGHRWFCTPDAGTLDADGRLHVLGRLDDIIVTGGEKVSPAAVESVLTGRAGVAECVVVGVPDAEWGHVVTAVVVPLAGSAPTTDGVREALRDSLPAHTLPRRVVVVEALPLRGPGKPDRRAAKALAAART